MDTKNGLYNKQGIHAIVSLFTIDDGKVKVLLVQRKNEPFCGYWCLLGGAVYNNETLEEAVSRELKEKSGINGIKPTFFGLFSNPDRAKETGFRMLGVGYTAVVDKSKVEFIEESEKAGKVKWWDLDKVPGLAYDHDLILKSAFEFLKSQIFNADILKTLYPEYVTIPELQNTFEKILGKTYDRRNFRKKVISVGLIVDSGLFKEERGKKPSKLYRIEQIEKFDI